MEHRAVFNILFEDFVGCPFPYCRQKICLSSEILCLYENGAIISKMRGFFTEKNDELYCYNCDQCIGDMRGDLAYLECNFYTKKVSFILIFLFYFSPRCESC